MVTNKDFMKALKERANGSHIVNENEKHYLSELAGSVVTVADYEKLTANNDDGSKNTFYAFTVEEHAGWYFNGGSALTSILEACDEAGEDFRGERIKVGAKVRISGGKTFTPVTIM